MELIKYDSNSLIKFYAENGLEFNDNKGYFGTNLNSYVLSENNKIIGAITTSVYKGKKFIEALAVTNKYRNNGNGTLLLQNVIKELGTPIYTISLSDKIYLKNGFCYEDIDLIDKECMICSKYNISCFPKVLVYK